MKKNISLYILMGISFVVMLLIFSGTDASGGLVFLISLIFGALIGFILWIILRAMKIIADDPQDAVNKFMGGTPEERKIEEAYKHGSISYMEYNTLKAKLKGEESMIETIGLNAAMAYSDKVGAERELSNEISQTDKKIIQSAAIGSAVGGLGGTIVGATTAAANQAHKIDELTKERDKADAKYRQELDKALKN